MELTEQQKEALTCIINFANDKEQSIFILKGYAGTGKTTMIKSLIPELQGLGKKVSLMAPTGRAAKVLRDKTGYEASTIHRRIYAFENMQAVRHDESGELIETNHTKNKELRSKGSDDLQFWFDIIKLEPGDDPSKNGYVLEAISEMQSADETETVKNIYSVFQQLLNQNKNGFKISRNDILSYDVEEIQDFIANEYMDFVLSIQKDPN